MTWNLFRLYDRQARRPVGKRRKRARLEFEHLEARQLLNANNLIDCVLDEPDTDPPEVVNNEPGDDLTNTAGENGENGTESQGEQRLPLEQFQAFFGEIQAALLQVQLPSDERFQELVAIGQRLGTEIQRVTASDFGSQYFIDLTHTQIQYGWTLDQVLLARRILEVAAGTNPDTSGGQGNGQLPVADLREFIYDIYGGLYEGKVPTGEQLQRLVEVGQDLANEIQRVAGVDASSQYLIDLSQLQLDFLATLDKVLLASKFPGGFAPGESTDPGEEQLPLDEHMAFLTGIQTGLYRGQLPSAEQFKQMAEVSQQLAVEIDRVTRVAPASRYLIDLAAVQAEFAKTLDLVLFANRIAGGAVSTEEGTNGTPAQDQGQGEDQLPLAEFQALLSEVTTGLLQGTLPTAEQFQDIIATGRRLADEINAVASKAPTSQYLINLVRVQAELAMALDRVLFARRMAERVIPTDGDDLAE